jgi:hypothetical protein
MTAVKIPACGVTPLAMAKAIASGSATIPTVMPAMMSSQQLAVITFRVSTRRGRKPVLNMVRLSVMAS